MALQVDRQELTGVGIARDEDRVDDPQRASALNPLERTDQPTLEVGIRAKSVDKELGGVCNPAQPRSTVIVPDWTLPWMVQWYVIFPAVLGLSA